MKLEGTWVDFRHQNRFDGDYWNDQTRLFTAQQWRGKVAEIHQLKMDTIVLMSSTLDNRAFFPSKFVADQWDLACNEPIQAVLEEAGRRKMRVFVSAGFYGHTTEETSDAPDFLDWHRKLSDDLWSRYGHLAAFYGWYIPNEAEINGQFSEKYVGFTATFAAHLRAISPGAKILIAPYGTNKVTETDCFVEQLQRLGVDFIAYQDEIGVQKTRLEQLPEIYGRLERLHRRAGLPLWADIEIFDFEGAVYQSPLIPAKMERVEEQLRLIGPHIEKALCYQTHGLMNPAGSPQHCGHPSSVQFYLDYLNWLKRVEGQ